jgi:hypothetical protein
MLKYYLEYISQLFGADKDYKMSYLYYHVMGPKEMESLKMGWIYRLPLRDRAGRGVNV